MVLDNLLRFLELRLDAHAQFEIRQYANVIGELVARWVPSTWEAFEEYRLGNVSLSASAAAVVQSWIEGREVPRQDSGLSQREWDVLTARFGRAG